MVKSTNDAMMTRAVGLSSVNSNLKAVWDTSHSRAMAVLTSQGIKRLERFLHVPLISKMEAMLPTIDKLMAKKIVRRELTVVLGLSIKPNHISRNKSLTWMNNKEFNGNSMA